MKKKTSLWISGITTVAMLAVAVGSFAAWDKLTAEENQFSATSGTPAVLTVTSTDFSTTDRLIPKISDTNGNKASVKATNDVTALTATVTPKMSSKGDKVQIKFTEPTITPTGGLTQASDYVVKVYKDYVDENNTGTEVIADTAFDYADNTPYTVVVTMKDGTTPTVGDGSAISSDALAVKLTFSAVAK
ncbi:hypothetical protein [Eubacterium callanderi]|uniref:hypothetical protein n=1 Tax=Eubacterium callanderi TaxID=53442 RepID=UPI001C10DF22|nr:hypothetical protein [Eubacterium callanderi]MBU5305115.1 hypothetical protein [Eubacterium callanderi]